jgi:hypothetical protein
VDRRLTELVAAGRLPADDPRLDEARRAAVDAGQRARAELGAQVRRLLAADVDEQWTTPLALLRGAVRYPAGVLQVAGVPPVERDSVQARLHPDDDYDLAPATFSDFGPEVAEAGLLWGAAKAYAHIQRHGGGRR